jgi:hypothetical protein
MKAHQQRSRNTIGSTIKLEQCQQQLLDLVNSAVRSFGLNNGTVDVKKVELDVKKLTQEAFPNGDWPDQLEPLPSLHIRIAQMLKAQGHYIEAAKHGIKGCMASERRVGPEWIQNLLELLQIFARVSVLPETHTTRRNSGFLNQNQLWHVIYGSLHILVLDAIKTFGPDAAYTQAIQHWYSQCLASGIEPLPGTRAFATQFKRIQSEMVSWAGLDDSRILAIAESG